MARRTHFAGLSVGDVDVSHVPVAAAVYTTGGGAAAEAITITGLLATDVPTVTMADDGTNGTTIVSAACTADTLTVTFSADPGADAIINYAVLRDSFSE